MNPHPCFHCNSPDTCIYHRENKGVTTIFQVTCRECGARGPRAASEEDCISSWNNAYRNLNVLIFPRAHVEGIRLLPTEEKPPELVNSYILTWNDEGEEVRTWRYELNPHEYTELITCKDSGQEDLQFLPIQDEELLYDGLILVLRAVLHYLVKTEAHNVKPR